MGHSNAWLASLATKSFGRYNKLDLGIKLEEDNLMALPRSALIGPLGRSKAVRGTQAGLRRCDCSSARNQIREIKLQGPTTLAGLLLGGSRASEDPIRQLSRSYFAAERCEIRGRSEFSASSKFSMTEEPLLTFHASILTESCECQA